MQQLNSCSSAAFCECISHTRLRVQHISHWCVCYIKPQLQRIRFPANKGNDAAFIGCIDFRPGRIRCGNNDLHTGNGILCLIDKLNRVSKFCLMEFQFDLQVRFPFLKLEEESGIIQVLCQINSQWRILIRSKGEVTIQIGDTDCPYQIFHSVRFHNIDFQIRDWLAIFVHDLHSVKGWVIHEQPVLILLQHQLDRSISFDEGGFSSTIISCWQENRRNIDIAFGVF